MYERSNAATLVAGIVALSEAGNWDKAKLEWGLDEVYRVDEPETCLCGHYPIVELCVIRNRVTRKCATVGNVCVKKFLGLPSDRIFDAIRRIAKDRSRPLGVCAVNHARARGWLTLWEYNFCVDTARRRSLSAGQATKRYEINDKVLAAVRNRPVR